MRKSNNLDFYKNVKIKTSNNAQIVVMLYAEAIMQLEKAIELLDANSKQYDIINTAIGKAKDIIMELASALDFSVGEFSHTLFGLYMWFGKQLSEGNIKKSSQPIKEVVTGLKELKAAWEVASKNIKNSVINNRESGFDISG